MLLLVDADMAGKAAACDDVLAPQQSPLLLLAQAPPPASEEEEVAVAGAIEAEAVPSQLLLLFDSMPLFDDADVVVAVAGVENFFLRSYGGD